MESRHILDARNIMVFSLILTSGAFFPDVPKSAYHAMQERWNLFKERIRFLLTREKDASFWEIDMTKFEP